MACKKKARQGGSTGSVMRKKKDEKSEMRQGGSTGSRMRRKKTRTKK